MARDASLELCDESRQIVTRLLTRLLELATNLRDSSFISTLTMIMTRCPVTPRDKAETVAGAEPRTQARPTLGRLGGGVAQVPAAVGPGAR